MGAIYRGKKIGFVTPWFGMDIPGGAEAELRGLAIHLHEAGVPLEILTTCVEKFTADWNKNFYEEGLTEEAGLTIRRFKVRKRDAAAFDRVNLKLINNEMPLSDEEEQTFVREMVNSPDLYAYMREHQEEYQVFVFIPYMFGTTYYGCQVAPEKSVLIPCFHDEAYFYMRTFQDAFSRVGGIVYNAQPEKDLVHKTYSELDAKEIVMGLGMDTELVPAPQRFREKYNITEPFILYAGRKDAGKNVDVLLRYFDEYKKRNPQKLKLILLGGGKIQIPKSCKQDVMDLGFVDVQDKYDAMGAAELLCQPSPHESFSIVIMESWLCGRPVLVADQCEVTKNFVRESNGGLYFADYFEFEGAVSYLLQHTALADAMGENGGRYVREHFAWDVIMEKYCAYFSQFAD